MPTVSVNAAIELTNLGERLMRGVLLLNYSRVEKKLSRCVRPLRSRFPIPATAGKLCSR
jgi:hypothetical protein